MKTFLLYTSLLIVFTGIAQESDQIKFFPLDNPDGLELINVKTEIAELNGKTGIKVVKSQPDIQDETLVIIPDVNFKNGTIELELAGERASGEDPNMRGFVGLAFRVNPENYSSYECFYLRPDNARANNQVRRNHSTQYISHPEYPWYRLREESPKMYESYVDLMPNEWTKIKIDVDGEAAKLYVHGAEQPCLIVNDLKHGESEGKIALWLHASTLAHYRNLKITHD